MTSQRSTLARPAGAKRFFDWLFDTPDYDGTVPWRPNECERPGCDGSLTDGHVSLRRRYVCIRRECVDWLKEEVSDAD